MPCSAYDFPTLEHTDNVLHYDGADPSGRVECRLPSSDSYNYKLFIISIHKLNRKDYETPLIKKRINTVCGLLALVVTAAWMMVACQLDEQISQDTTDTEDTTASTTTETGTAREPPHLNAEHIGYTYRCHCQRSSSMVKIMPLPGVNLPGPAVILR